MRIRPLFWLIPAALLVASAVGLSAATAADQFNGQPKFSEGKALGYFVWKDGDTWKLRWMTFGSNHKFSGRITVEGGEIRSFKRVDVDTERKVIAPGRPGRVVRGPRGRVRGVVPGRAPVTATREEDHINQEDEHLIQFVTRTDDDLDGLDFKVTDGTTVIRMRLEIDDQARASEIEVGRGNVKPGEDPLVITLR